MRSFDLVTCRIAPHHFPDIPTFVAETWRVLKPGGTFALVDNIAPDTESTPGFSNAELRDAALTYNAFEKIRDPSHGRCLGMAEWSEVLSDTGFDIVHKERLPKDMEFQSWGERLGCDAATIRAAALHAGGRIAGAAGVPQAAYGRRQAVVHARRSHPDRPQAGVKGGSGGQTPRLRVACHSRRMMRRGLTPLSLLEVLTRMGL